MKKIIPITFLCLFSLLACSPKANDTPVEPENLTITLSENEKEIFVDDVFTLTASTNIEDVKVKWMVSLENPMDVVELNDLGNNSVSVKALKAGSAVIDAYNTRYDQKASFSLTIKEQEPEIKYLSVTEAVSKASEYGEEGKEDYVTGTIKSISNSIYGEMYITDGENDIYIYGLYSFDGSVRYQELEDKPYTGDEIFVLGNLKLYNGSPELGRCCLISYISHRDEFNTDDYAPVTINEAREKEEGEKLIINGVVAYITYANGYSPNGAYIVDETGSIYVYGIELAGRLKIGNKVKIAGTKTYYILEGEKNNAAVFGYKGSCQLQEAHLLDNDNLTHEFDKSWIQESTIKDIIETPVSENITTSIFKVNGYINEVPGSGFTNYYLNDLDNKTGSYCYSMNNGHDFDYLKPYDGKICTIYLSPINCKATNSSAYFRFIPVLVVDEEFTFDPDYAPEFAIKYYIKDQFLSSYQSDPSLELLTSVSHEDFALDNIEISYQSNKPELLSFDVEDNKLFMHIHDGNDVVDVTLSASYLGKSYQEVIHINVNSIDIPEDYITIKEALEANDGSEVTVCGVVMASLINQTGFYLVDETGSIAIRTTSEIISKIELGQKVFMRGTRAHVKKDTSSNIGTSCLDNSTLVLNLYGNHAYSDESFEKDMSFEEIFALINDMSVDQTMKIYRTRCYLKKAESQYYTNFYLTNKDKNKDIRIYASSGSQVSMFNSLVGDRELEVEFTLVDWNSKSSYTCCLLKASDGENTIINNLNFR